MVTIVGLLELTSNKKSLTVSKRSMKTNRSEIFNFEYFLVVFFECS